MSFNYRSTLYARYHSTQSGRAALVDSAALHEREKDRFRREFGPLVASLSREASVFDLGCGSGSLIAVLKEMGFHRCLGMDLSPEQVQQAKQWGINEVEEGDALAHIRQQSQQYDAVLAADIIEHFSKDELVELLSAIKSSLKPGGRLLLRTPNLDAPMASVFAQGDFTHENYLNASSLEQVLKAVGFTQVSLQPSDMKVAGLAKELLRRLSFALLTVRLKWTLFATGRSTRGVLLSPNMIAIAYA